MPGEAVPSNPPNTNPPFAPFKSEAADYPSFIPKQPGVIGALASAELFPQNKNVPKLFEPITIRGVTWPHRMWVAPMCMCESQRFRRCGCLGEEVRSLYLIIRTWKQMRMRDDAGAVHLHT